MNATHASTARRARGRRSALWWTGGEPGRSRARALHDGPDPGEEVRHPDEVGQDVVAVEADGRHQLLHHFEVHDEGGQQEEALSRSQEEGREDDEAPDVEVEAAQVGAQTAASREPVGVGHVGVERREEEVDPDGPWPPAPVDASSRVTGLVNEAAERQQGVEREEQRRRRQDIGDGHAQSPARNAAMSSRTAARRAPATMGGQKKGARTCPSRGTQRAGTRTPRSDRARSGRAIGGLGAGPVALEGTGDPLLAAPVTARPRGSRRVSTTWVRGLDSEVTADRVTDGVGESSDRAGSSRVSTMWSSSES